jgi:AcrR family transcriptional regulator
VATVDTWKSGHSWESESGPGSYPLDVPDANKPRRRDAVENRVALLAAAQAEFSRDGYGIPLGRIADAARVSRATMCRHFKAREDLIAAIAEADLAGVEEFAAQCASCPDGLRALLEHTWRVQQQSPGVVAARGITNRKMLRERDIRTRAAFAPVLVHSRCLHFPHRSANYGSNTTANQSCCLGKRLRSHVVLGKGLLTASTQSASALWSEL